MSIFQCHRTVLLNWLHMIHILTTEFPMICFMVEEYCLLGCKTCSPLKVHQCFKCWLTYNKSHSVIFDLILLFMTTALRTSNPTYSTAVRCSHILVLTCYCSPRKSTANAVHICSSTQTILD